MTNLPFSYSELMKLPIKMINYIYESADKEHKRKQKEMQKSGGGLGLPGI